MYLLGGTAALSEGVESALAELGYQPVRFAGADRFATAMVAERFFSTPAFVGMASGETFPDVLSGGVASAMRGGPLMLTASTALSTATAGFLSDHAPTIEEVQLHGGPAAVGQAVRDAVVAMSG